MKNQTIDLSAFKGLQALSIDQMQSIEGGGEFWDIVSYAAGVTAKVIYTFAKDAVTYQQSLPPNLKK
ncbi:MAG: hypothetical protein B7Y11_12760 [Sphingobacteriia bacterium 24-36-13]|jgi:hypothetical protein|uniref:hypothetical protein n=2 Tax=Sediminibacterium sp. TaxID=1917865 RepID=UPI000BD2BF9D|nr:hypothetical protein [Sediminibacterium sp.]OYY07422.1 MAG: hypothetical protein B7Y66_12705 [Sphingobacteriia bacterium 35-36-14]OYZ52052.1 MAG: hypothetical protein B7Y11_12760 [Sphingobacteriia bacterium 24-36-13]HQS25390.1 hypothetical protein [Sediminibacterium sp.]